MNFMRIIQFVCYFHNLFIIGSSYIFRMNNTLCRTFMIYQFTLNSFDIVGPGNQQFALASDNIYSPQNRYIPYKCLVHILLSVHFRRLCSFIKKKLMILDSSYIRNNFPPLMLLLF